MAEEDKIRAIHVEVEASNAQEALKTMSKHYGKSKSTLPGGQRMRFFPEYHRVRTVDNQNKILEMKKAKQHSLMSLNVDITTIFICWIKQSNILILKLQNSNPFLL